jgi:hypothetical protein
MHEKLFHGLVVEQEDFDLLNARELLGSLDLTNKIGEFRLREVVNQLHRVLVDKIHNDSISLRHDYLRDFGLNVRGLRPAMISSSRVGISQNTSQW